MLGFGGTLAILSDLIDNTGLTHSRSPPVFPWRCGSYCRRLRSACAAARPGVAILACGVYALRFARLAVMIGAAYVALFRWVHPFLFERVYHHFTRDMTSEREAAMLRIGLYVVSYWPSPS
jgi:hypothetical protein